MLHIRLAPEQAMQLRLCAGAAQEVHVQLLRTCVDALQQLHCACDDMLMERVAVAGFMEHILEAAEEAFCDTFRNIFDVVDLGRKWFAVTLDNFKIWLIEEKYHR